MSTAVTVTTMTSSPIPFQPSDNDTDTTILVDIARTLRRLETSLVGQDKRLYVIEQSMRSSRSSSSMTSHGRQGDDILNFVSGSHRHDSPTSSLTSPPSPASPYQELVGEALRKNYYEFSDDDENEAEVHQRGDVSGLGVLTDARSVSIYSQHPSRLVLNDMNTAIRLDRDGVISVSYDDVIAGPPPSLVKPLDDDEQHARSNTAGQDHGQQGLARTVRRVYSVSIKSLKTRARSVSFLNVWRVRRGNKAVPVARVDFVNAKTAEKTDTAISFTKPGELGFGVLSFVRCIVTIFTTKHRVRPYIVA